MALIISLSAGFGSANDIPLNKYNVFFGDLAFLSSDVAKPNIPPKNYSDEFPSTLSAHASILPAFRAIFAFKATCHAAILRFLNVFTDLQPSQESPNIYQYELSGSICKLGLLYNPASLPTNLNLFNLAYTMEQNIIIIDQILNQISTQTQRFGDIGSPIKVYFLTQC